MDAYKPFDSETMFSDATDISAWTMAGSPYTSSEIDLGEADGEQYRTAVVQVVIPGLSSGGAATIAIAVRDTATAGSGHAALITTRAYTIAEMLAGVLIPLPIRPRKRYVEVEYTVGTANLTGGTLHAGLVK